MRRRCEAIGCTVEVRSRGHPLSHCTGLAFFTHSEWFLSVNHEGLFTPVQYGYEEFRDFVHPYMISFTDDGKLILLLQGGFLVFIVKLFVRI